MTDSPSLQAQRDRSTMKIRDVVGLLALAYVVVASYALFPVYLLTGSWEAAVWFVTIGLLGLNV